MEYVTCQLRHSGILEAIHIRKKGYPVRLPFQNFLGRYSGVLGILQPLKSWMNLLAHCDLFFSEDSSYSFGFCHINISSSRYGLLAGRRHNCLEEREVCAAVLSHVVGSPSDLYQIGVTKVMPIENPILIAQAQPPICWLSTDREQLGSLPKEGKQCMPSLPFCFASCLKYDGGIFSISDEEMGDSGSRLLY